MMHLLARPTALPFGLSRCNRVLSKGSFTDALPTCPECLLAQQREAGARSAATAQEAGARAPKAPVAPSVAPMPPIGLRPIGATPASAPAPKIGLRPLAVAAVVDPPPPPPPVASPEGTPAPEAHDLEARASEEMDLDFEALQEHYAVLRRLEAALPDPLPEDLEALAEMEATFAGEDGELLAAVDGALHALGLVRIPQRLAGLRHRADMTEEDEAAPTEEDVGSAVSDKEAEAEEAGSPEGESDASVSGDAAIGPDPSTDVLSTSSSKASKRAGRKA